MDCIIFYEIQDTKFMLNCFFSGIVKEVIPRKLKDHEIREQSRKFQIEPLREFILLFLLAGVCQLFEVVRKFLKDKDTSSIIFRATVSLDPSESLFDSHL